MELKDLRSKQNHSIPAELVDCSNTIVVIMPFLMVIESVTWWQFPLNVLFESMSNLIEGLKFMHGQHIAHVDIHTTNAVFSENNVVAGDFKIPRFKTFYIDFGSSRYIPPGADPVIQDYEERGGHYDPPQGLNDVDVFAYDVFALGSLFKDMIEHAGRYSPHRGHIPRSVSLFTEKLTCDQDIHRPNIRQTQAVWTELHRRIKLQSNRVWLSHEQRLAAEIHSWEQVAKLFRL
ncbi:hypothetical protein EUX98_g7888 [Antrodiella citrinella]|uniref:Protein kinase domain-containing protein n=1 Tax=Antrodiella citrinella TaxID=2447956 RepID=A0A4S4MKY9_9APHY|nr:hypothetical protein EUX98_g7888 [Antrodiella citrinella]